MSQPSIITLSYYKCLHGPHPHIRENKGKFYLYWSQRHVFVKSGHFDRQSGGVSVKTVDIFNFFKFNFQLENKR